MRVEGLRQMDAEVSWCGALVASRGCGALKGECVRVFFGVCGVREELLCGAVGVAVCKNIKYFTFILNILRTKI